MCAYFDIIYSFGRKGILVGIFIFYDLSITHVVCCWCQGLPRYFIREDKKKQVFAVNNKRRKGLSKLHLGLLIWLNSKLRGKGK